MNKEYQILAEANERWHRRALSISMAAIVTILALVFLVASSYSQEPDRWRGMILDESTPDDAIKAFGKPKKDGIDKFIFYGAVGNSLSKRTKEKIFRHLRYEFGKKEGVQMAVLTFLEDKLVGVLLDVKSGEVNPNGLANIYGVPFTPAIGALDLAFFPKNTEINQGRAYPKTYPTVYDLVGPAEKSIVVAMISNVPSVFGALGKSMGLPDTPGTFPGKVEMMWLISRKLENKDGADFLK